MLHVVALLAAQVLAPPAPPHNPAAPCFASLCNTQPYACFAKDDRCAPAPRTQFIVVRIEADDSVNVGNRRVLLRDLSRVFQTMAAQRRTGIRILADPLAHYGAVHEVVNDAKAAGLQLKHPPGL
jgi:hypothetical protein